jgi:ribosomal protein S18 acetylase RimI-like enzyme
MLQAHYAAHVNLNLSRRASCCALLNGEIVGVMLMCTPGEVTATAGETLIFLARALLHANPAIIWRGMRNNIADEKHRPKEPNYFLETIGVDPKFQRRGIGSALLSYLAGLADRDRVLTYLSTTDPRTVIFYERFGFQTTAKTNPTGVPNYHMVREPKQP